MKIFFKSMIQFFVIIIVFLKIDQAYSFADIISLTVSSGQYSDQAIVRLENQSTYSFDSNWDAYKLTNSGNTPNLFTTLNGVKYSINSIPADSDKFSISLNLQVAFTADYLITVKSLKNSYDSTLTILLEDRFLNQVQELQQNTTYSFSAVLGDNSNRFVLHYQRKISKSDNTGPIANQTTPLANDTIPSTEDTTSSINDTILLQDQTDPTSDNLVNAAFGKMDVSQIKLMTGEDGITINFNTTQSINSSIEVISSEGRAIYYEENIPSSSNHHINLNNYNGGNIYIVRIINNNGIFNKKINF